MTSLISTPLRPNGRYYLVNRPPLRVDLPTTFLKLLHFLSFEYCEFKVIWPCIVMIVIFAICFSRSFPLNSPVRQITLGLFQPIASSPPNHLDTRSSFVIIVQHSGITVPAEGQYRPSDNHRPCWLLFTIGIQRFYILESRC